MAAQGVQDKQDRGDITFDMDMSLKVAFAWLQTSFMASAQLCTDGSVLQTS